MPVPLASRPIAPSRPPGDATGIGDKGAYFALRGIWAPGVWLFRKLRFHFKASTISLAFVLPLVVLLGLFVTDRIAQINNSRNGLVGVSYVREVMATLKLAQERRRQTLRGIGQSAPQPELQTVQAALHEQMARLVALDSTLGAKLRTQESISQIQLLDQAAAPAAAGLFKVFASHTKLTEALTRLTLQAADHSGLTLDAGMDSHYAIDAGVIVLAEMIEFSARMHGLSSAMSQTQQVGEVAAQELARIDALLEFVGSRLETDLGKVIQRRPDLKARLDPRPAADLLTKLRDLATDSPGAGGAKQAQEIQAAGDRALASLSALQLSAIDVVEQILTDRVGSQQRSMLIALVACGLCLLLAAYLGYCFFLDVDGSIREVSHHIQAMGEGDMCTRPRSVSRDELGYLLERLHEMQQALSTTLAAARGTAEQLTEVSLQVAAGTSDMAHRTEQTANRLEQASSSMQQMSSTTAETAASTHEAAELARANAEVATRGGQVIGQVEMTMQGIQGTSAKVKDIISVIDAIAFQTNILALNAAVEAARAGEQGKGFAVVASEVRTLAKRSADAAREINALIVASVASAASGASVVKHAGTTMAEIVTAARRMESLLAGIATATRQQTAEISQVNQSVGEVDRMTQQNAALVQQTSAAAGSMKEHASALSSEVARFRLQPTV